MNNGGMSGGGMNNSGMSNGGMGQTNGMGMSHKKMKKKKTHTMHQGM